VETLQLFRGDTVLLKVGASHSRSVRAGTPRARATAKTK
jgi:hypothetical protein